MSAPLHCPFCKKFYRSWHALNSHMAYRHEKELLKYTRMSIEAIVKRRKYITLHALLQLLSNGAPPAKYILEAIKDLEKSGRIKVVRLPKGLNGNNKIMWLVWVRRSEALRNR